VVDDRSKFAEPKDPRVEAALREYLERVDRGEPVDREEFLARHALIADQLRSFVAAEDEVQKLAGGETPLDRAYDSTKSFVGHGHETIAPQSVAKRDAESGGLKGQFGRYRIIRTLGKGAMGTVYLAEDTQLERSVAIKTPHFTESPSEDSLERFYREARTAGTLRHHNICPIHDVGQIDGKHYISMAYIEGRPLSAYIQPDKPQTERQILIVVRKLALALQEAHDHGIVHRDLKPANIMIDKKGEPIIMDFGLARQTRREGDIRLTQTGDIIGTPAYMSPEQIEGEPDRIGPQTDQYSLGVVLYELLTTKLPFRGSVIAVMGQILTKEVTPPGQMRPDLDPRIEVVCLKMMAKAPSERFASTKAAANELAAILKSPHAKAASKEKTASSPAPSPPADRMRADAIASQDRKSQKPKAVTESDLASLEELARKCYSRRDLEQVIQIIERIPEEKRNAGLAALLEKARGKADEIAFLICEIDEAERLNDGQTALKKAEALLKVKPGHHRALEVQEKYSAYGEGGAARIGILDQFRRPLNDGGWIPWSVLACGLAVFGVMTGVIVIYLNRTAVVIDIQDPGVEVAVKGTTLTITGPDKQSVKVVPGDQELTITCAGLETTTRRFSLKKGDKKTVTVSIVNKEIVARLKNEILPPTPGHEEKATRPTAGGKSPATASLPPTFTNSLGMEFVLVPKGKSWLGGGDGKVGDKEVVIAHDFYLGKYEVTQEEWAKVTGLTPSHFSRTGGGKDKVKEFTDAELKRFPVEQVSWDDAQSFLDRLNKREQEAGWVYRLPKEADWEYACRGGPLSDKFESAYDFYFDKPTNQLLPEQANFGRGSPDRALKPKLGRTRTVGSYKPNRLGLYDMHGNVLEWCDDAKMRADAASLRVYRGGCWDYGSDGCGAAVHWAFPPSDRVYYLGLRVARVRIDQRGVSHLANAAKQADTATANPNAPQLLVAPFDEATAKKGQEAWARHFKTPVELSNAIGMKLVLIPPGEFQMGSADTRLPADTRPVHRVRITKPFYMGIYEVTQEEYKRIMGFNPSPDQSDPRLPVTKGSWERTLDFLRKLGEMPEEKKAGRVYRLPTEAEWEYACRAGTETTFYTGDVITTRQANFDSSKSKLGLGQGPSLNRLAKVGSYPPNAFGLYDMHGNALEAVLDWYSPRYYAASPVDDPQGPSSPTPGELAIGRGGSYDNPAIPSGYRFPGPRSEEYSEVGFRVVCNIAEPTFPAASSAPDAADRAAAVCVLDLGGVVALVPSAGGSPVQIFPNFDGSLMMTSDDDVMCSSAHSLADLDQIPFWAQPFVLRDANLWGRKGLTDANLERLKGLKGLQTLNLAHTAVSNLGLEHLRELTSLKMLRINDTAVTAEGVRRLQEALPQCTISLEPAISYRKLAAGSWTRVMTTRNDTNMNPEIEFANGTLHLTKTTAIPVPGWRGRDMAIRAKVKKVGGQSLSLRLRLHPGTNWKGYVASFNGGRSFGMGDSKEAGWVGFMRVSTPHDYPDFFEFTLAALGDTVAVFVEGRQIYEFRDPNPITGDLVLSTFEAEGLFKQVEVQRLK
jgi:formylglycine-generating enzyme required for sulfatase activity/serine/threonine protein kinase